MTFRRMPGPAALVLALVVYTNTAPQAAGVGLEAEASRSRVYVGQELRYTVRFALSDDRARATYQEPSFEGFQVVRLPRRELRRPAPDGRARTVTEIPCLLRPLRPGILRIPPATLAVEAPPGSGGATPGARPGRDDPFFDRTPGVKRVLRTRPVSVEAVPLPPWSGAPPFQGAVGRFRLRLRSDTLAVAAGRGAAVSVSMEGCGNFGSQEPPQLDAPRSVRVHPGPTRDLVVPGPEGSCGERRFSYVVVPGEPGTVRLGPLRLVYFDPGSGRYETARAGPLDLTVTPGDPGAPRFFRTAPGVVVLVLLVAGLLWYRSRRSGRAPPREDPLPDPPAPEGWTEAPCPEEKLRLLHRALLRAVQARPGERCRVLTPREVLTLLAERGYPPHRAQEVVRLLETLDRARFAPPHLRPDDLDALAVAVARRIDELTGNPVPGEPASGNPGITGPGGESPER